MHNETRIFPTFSGTTTSILNVTSIVAEDDGVYSCSVSNGIQPNGEDQLRLPLPGKQKKKRSSII